MRALLALFAVAMAAAAGCDGGTGRDDGRKSKAGDPEPGSFRWAMRNPEAKHRMAESARARIERRQREENRVLSPAEIRGLVARLGDPALRRCAKDADPLERWPIERILDRLQRYAPPEIVPLITDLVRHESSKMRWLAALALGNVASDEALAPLRVLLADDDEWVRSGAVMGVGKGLRAGRGSAAFRKAVFADTVASLTNGQPSPVDEIPGLLLDLDRETGRAALLDDRIFRPDHASIYRVLRAFNERKSLIPPAKLRPLMKALRRRWADYPATYAYGECLVALARIGPADAEAVIRAAFEAPADTVVDTACAALLILHELDDVSGVILDRNRAVEFAGLTAHERVYLAVSALDASITSDGFHGFFGSGYGNLTSATLAALEEIGAVETHKVMLAACRVFGPQGPSDRYRERLRQVARLTPAQEERLGKLDRRYYAQSREQAVRLTEFVLAHRKAFRQSLAEAKR